MNYMIGYCCIAALICCCSLPIVNCKGQTWVLCVSGYNLYKYTYGFEAGMYRLCGMAKNANTIIISPDTIAYNKNNAVHGRVVHDQDSPDEGPNYYENINVTFNSANTTAGIFYNMLLGNKRGLRGYGNGKVLESGPEDTLIIAFITIGDNGVFALTNDQMLWANEIVPVLEILSKRKKFKHLFFYMDAPMAGSTFDGYLDTDKNILVWTNGAKQDNFQLCQNNPDVKAYTATCHTLYFLNFLEYVINKGWADKLTVAEFYQIFRRKIFFLPSQPNLYGQLELTSLKVSELLGPLVALNKPFQRVSSGSDDSDFEELVREYEKEEFFQLPKMNNFLSSIGANINMENSRHFKQQPQ